MSTSEVTNLTAVPASYVEGAASDPEPDPGGADEVGPQEPAPETRDRSSVVFPYDELASAEAVARMIFENYGDRCAMDQLAGSFGQKTSSGAFRIKVTSARIFGFVTVSRQGVALTELGQRVLDERTAAEARVTAFLNVPLYNQLYERFRGKTLPPGNTPLEGIIREMGVAPKQARTARWRFQKSAETAGFFAHGNDRLVVPSLQASDPGGGERNHGNQKLAVEGDASGMGGQNDGVDQHPLMVGLIQSLPTPGENFPTRARDRWLNAVKVNFDFIYGPDEEAEPSTPERHTS